jgi:hypothetical protein
MPQSSSNRLGRNRGSDATSFASKTVDWEQPDEKHRNRMNFTSLEKQQDRIWGAIIKDDVKKFAEDKKRVATDKKARQAEMAAHW